MTFDHFMRLATECQFSISFGEGFDGYLAQPIHQGGMGLTVYREAFFPSDHFRSYYNIFGSEQEMVAELATRLRRLAAEPDLYQSINRAFQAEYEQLYSQEDYARRIRLLALRKFELFPQQAPVR